ncbi:MAG: SIMPL domain-containing protein [Pseudomonadota bacterium]|nr:MAG: SIMPL domain-containing protein [Pseudomonadota bacterium]
MNCRYLLAVLLALLASAPVAAADPPKESEPAITVGGEGTITVAPDTAHVDVGVISEAAKASAALTDNNRAMERLFDTLAAFEIDRRDLQTRSFNVHPRYQPTAQGEEPKISGYRVTNQVTVTMRKIEGLGKLIDALVGQGANRVGGIRFAVADPTALLDKARAVAVEDARRRAGVFARAAGLKLGRVVFVRERSAPPPMPLRPRAAMMHAESAVPVASGELQLRVHVTAGFAAGG